MATTTITAPAQIKATINYYRPPEHGGEDSFVPGTVAVHRRKYTPKSVAVSEQHPIDLDVADIFVFQIEDIRGQEAEFSLSKNGFQVIQHDLRNDDFLDEDKMKEMYPMIEQEVMNM